MAAGAAFMVTAFPPRGAAVTPDDSNDLPGGPGHIRSNEAGDIAYIPVGNADVDVLTLTVVAGEYIPNIVRRVMATGTTVADMTVHF